MSCRGFFYGENPHGAFDHRASLFQNFRLEVVRVRVFDFDEPIGILSSQLPFSKLGVFKSRLDGLDRNENKAVVFVLN